MRVKVSGSLMLFGEHGVLSGVTGIAMAINRQIFLELKVRSDRNVIIDSEGYETYLTSLDDFKIVERLRFVLQSIASLLPEISRGFNLTIRSEFKDNLGFGSSAAVTVGTLALIYRWLNNTPMAKYRLWRRSLAIIQKIQGEGSGGDLAASIYGGIVKYRKEGFLNFKQIDLPITAVYCGYKRKTAEVIKLVKVQVIVKKRNRIYQAMDRISRRAWRVILKGDWASLGELMDRHRDLQKLLGVEDQKLGEIIAFLRSQKLIFGAKISGAGLGDCVLGIGETVEDCPILDSLTFRLKTGPGLIYD